jgi:hypothetical protein
MEDTGIVLDPAIRDWVLIPIFVVMVLQGLLRGFLSKLLASKKAPPNVEQVCLVYLCIILCSVPLLTLLMYSLDFSQFTIG